MSEPEIKTEPTPATAPTPALTPAAASAPTPTPADTAHDQPKVSPFKKLASLGLGIAAKIKAKSTAKFKEKRDPAKLSPVTRAYLEIVDALFSKNPQGRRMAILFFASVAGVLLVLSITVHRIVLRMRVARVEAARLVSVHKRREAWVLKEAEASKDQERWVSLGLYSVEVYPDEDHALALKNRVDIEFGGRCVDRQTREFLDARQTQVRGEITDSLTGLQREDLLTPIGKFRLKRKINDRLNRWIFGEYPKGKVEEIYISNLSIR